MYNDIFPSEPERNWSGAERKKVSLRSGAERSEKKVRSENTDFKYTKNIFSKRNAVSYDVSNNINKNTHFYGAVSCLEIV